MSLIDKIPSMNDVALGNLLANARHLATAGAAKQQADAAELLPVLEAAMAERKAAKAEAAAAKRAANRKPAAPKATRAVV
jgi:hypothetical protein